MHVVTGRRIRLHPVLWTATSACLFLFSSPGLAQFRGAWEGHWENSVGQRGEARLFIAEEYGDTVRGEWDGERFEGHRHHEELNFHIHGANRGCTDYEVRVVFDGDSARVNYDAHDHCSEPHRYSGWERLHFHEEHGGRVNGGA